MFVLCPVIKALNKISDPWLKEPVLAENRKASATVASNAIISCFSQLKLWAFDFAPCASAIARLRREVVVKAAWPSGASSLDVARRHGLVAYFPEQRFRYLDELVAFRWLRHRKSPFG